MGSEKYTINQSCGKTKTIPSDFHVFKDLLIQISPQLNYRSFRSLRGAFTTSRIIKIRYREKFYTLKTKN